MGGKHIQAQPDPELRERFDRFAEEWGLDQSKATRKAVDEGLRALGYGPNGSTRSQLQVGLKGAGTILVLFAFGLFGFGAFAAPSVVVFTNPLAFMMVVAGAGMLFVATVLEAASEHRLPGSPIFRRHGG